jgi:alkylhydroperoxidase/carboxymuconolactone decarboxylase family protein YurZ
MTNEPEWAELLRQLALNDERAVAAVVTPVGGETVELAETCQSLLRIAVLIASDSAATSYQWAVSQARAAGVSDQEIVETLRVVAPIVGSARVAVAARPLAAALGYEVDALDE